MMSLIIKNVSQRPSLLLKAAAPRSTVVQPAVAEASVRYFTGGLVSTKRDIKQKMDKTVDALMNKEFPGYYDKAGEKKQKDLLGKLDVAHHDEQKAQKLPLRLNCETVTEILNEHHAVEECVVIDINVNQQAEIPVAFVVPKPGVIKTDKLHKELIDSIRTTLGPDHEMLQKDLVAKLSEILESKEILEDEIQDELLHCVREQVGPFAVLKVVVVEKLPKTTSGMILRGLLYKIAKGEPYTITPRIEDPNVLQQLEKEIKTLLGHQYS